MKSVIGKSLALGLLAGVAAVAACSSHNVGPSVGTSTPAPAQTGEGTGTVGFQYTIPNGHLLSSVHYVLTNGTNTYTNNVDVSEAGSISFVIPGVTAGTGYTITLSGTTTDGVDTCQGATGTTLAADAGFWAGVGSGAPFAVANRTTTQVNVQLVCFDNANLAQGNVLVNAQTNCCATWDTAVSNPQSTASAPLSLVAGAGLGNVTTLTANASGPCSQPDGGQLVNCTWTLGTGAQGTVGATSTDGMGNFIANYTCPTAGTGSADTLNLDCTDGPLPDGGSCPSASTHFTTQVFCGAPPKCAAPGESGVVATPDTATGTCPAATPVNVGTADALGDFCCETAVAFCGANPVATPFGPTGTCTGGLVNNGLGCCISCSPPAGDQTKCNTYANANKATNHNTSGSTCTATEDVLFQVDGTGTCLGCMMSKGCLDDTVGDTGQECEDPINNGTEAQCLAVLECGMGVPTTTCGVSTGAPAKGNAFNPFCGVGETASQCEAASPGPTGACVAAENAGFVGLGSNATSIVNNFGSTAPTYASSIANNIFACGITNCSAQCGL